MPLPWPKLTMEQWRERLGLPAPAGKAVRLDPESLRAARRSGVVYVKYNESHDERGRFATGDGGGAASSDSGSGASGSAATSSSDSSGSSAATKTPEFKAWFGDSKVADESGNPLVVYHGTESVFSSFNVDASGDGAIYFTTDRDSATFFAENAGRLSNPTPTVVPAYLAISNPEEITYSELRARIGDEVDPIGIDWTSMVAVVDGAKRAGHDGIHLIAIPEYNGRIADQWLAFEATQIKSAVGNSGAFDPKNPDITKHVVRLDADTLRQAQRDVVWIPKYSEDEPRDDQGQWTSGGGSESGGGGAGGGTAHEHDLLARLSKPDGGFTYQPHTDQEPTQGYALSVYPERSYGVDAAEMDYEKFSAYALKNDDLLQNPEHHIGGWHDPASGRIFLDVSVVKSDRGEAETLALKHDQIAYFDLGSGKSVTVNPDATSGGAAKSHGGETEARTSERPWGQSHGGALGGHVRKAHRQEADRGRDSQDPATDRREKGSTAVTLDADTLRSARRPGVVYVPKYSPDQPRDHGQFAEVDGGASNADAGRPGESAAPPAQGVDAGNRSPVQDAAKSTFVPEPVAFVKSAAASYNAERNLAPVREGVYVEVDESRAQRIAEAFDALPAVDTGPETTAAFHAAAAEIEDQWRYAEDKMGMTFEAWTKEGQPYANSQEMRADVADNKHLAFFTGGEPHPLLSTAGPDGLTPNDKLRAVHDLFGHAAEGYGFGPRGEENAWIAHSQMFSPAAQRAITTETRGQNSWVNFGKQNYNADGSSKNIPPPDRPYAQQKAALLPAWASDWKTVLPTKAIRLDPATLRAARRPGVVYVPKFNENHDDHGRFATSDSTGGPASGRDRLPSDTMGGDAPEPPLGSDLPSRAERVTAFRGTAENEVAYQSAATKLAAALEEMPGHENVQLDVIADPGAYYEETTGSIGVDVAFANSMPQTQLAAVLRHEISHERLRSALHDDTTAKEFETYVAANSSALFVEGVKVSPYAQSHWVRAERFLRWEGDDVRGPRVTQYKVLAINETLAEIHRTNTWTPAYKGVETIIENRVGKFKAAGAESASAGTETWPVIVYVDANYDPVDTEAAAALVYTFERNGNMRITRGANRDSAKRASVRLDADTLRAARRTGVVYVPKYNPSHDDRGRFAQTDGAGSGDSGAGSSGGSSPSGNGGGSILAGTAATAALLPKSVDPAIIPRAENLSPEQRVIETRFAEQLAADPRGAWDRYMNLKDSKGESTTADGKILSVDSARELSADWLADPSHSATIQEPASWFIKAAYAARLQQPPGPGEDARVLFMSGGTGAGKTTGLKAADPTSLARAQIIYDGNFGALASSELKLNQALDAGKTVGVTHIYRDPYVAFVAGVFPDGPPGKGVLTRAMRTGRTVPLEAHIKTHLDSRATAPLLEAKYAADHRVEFRYFDNTGHGASSVTRVAHADNLPKTAYTSLRKDLYAALERAHREGRISERVYRRTLNPTGGD